MKFNEQQQKAIDFFEGACAVIAQAGAGKSTVLSNRVKNLAYDYDINQESILTISFTRNTADELKKKLKKMGCSSVNVGTFHSVCARILAMEGIDVSKRIQEWEAENIFRGIDKQADPKDILSFIGYQKNYMKSYNDDFVKKESEYSEEELRVFFKAYEDYKTDKHLYDFEDWLIKCCQFLQEHPNSHTFDFVLVDEHQDTNLVQNLLLKELCPKGNVFCVFDYRQAIYSFRGGNPEYCMNFHKEWKDATIIHLDINYRSCNNIVENANGFIKLYYGDYEFYSDGVANNKRNGMITINSYITKSAEASDVADRIEQLIAEGRDLNDIAVLYRLNANSSYVENELKSRGIPYDISSDSSFFNRKEISAIMSYLRLVFNPHDENAFETIYKLRNYPLQFFSNKILDDIKVFSGQNNLSYYESFIMMKMDKIWQKKNVDVFSNNIMKLRLQMDKGLSIQTLIDNIIKVFKLEEFLKEKYTNKEDFEDRMEAMQTLKTFVKGGDVGHFISYVYNQGINEKKKTQDHCVKLMSIHASKGLEWRDVFVIGIEDGKFPHNKSTFEEEARLAYVAYTRAIENLYLSEIGIGNKFINEYPEKRKQKLKRTAIIE